MKNSGPFEGWSEEKLEEHFEWDASLRIKPHIAASFLGYFTWFFLSPNLLRDWAQTNYNLTLEELQAKIPDLFPPLDYKLLGELRAKIVAFGIRVFRLGEIKAESSGISFVSLADTSIVSEKYKEAKEKYAKVGPKEIYNVFRDSIKDILNTFLPGSSPKLAKSNKVDLDLDRWEADFRFGLFPFFVEEIVRGIFDWAMWLDSGESRRISSEIGRLEGKINSEEEWISFLEVNGFDAAYFNRCWENMFHSSGVSEESLGEEGFKE